MKIVERQHGEVELVLEAAAPNEHRQVFDSMSKFRMIRHGSSYFVYRKAGELVAHYNSFDNTQLVIHPEEFALAGELGSKRFPIGAARQQLDAAKALAVNAIRFPRDVAFSLQSNDAARKHTYQVADLKQLLSKNQNREAKLYVDLAELFERCSDYTPAKKAEINQGGQADKFCRFNLDNYTAKSGVARVNTFLLDEKNNNKVVGTVSATIVVHPDNQVDIYMYDEVVDYYTVLSPEQIQEYKLFCANKAELSQEDKEMPIVKLIESRRVSLLAPLFAEARQLVVMKLHEMLPDCKAKDIEQMIAVGKIRAMIRAAAAWYPSSKILNCVGTEPGVFVIHGKRTELGDKLDEDVKNWANKCLQENVTEYGVGFFEQRRINEFDEQSHRHANQPQQI